jgi:2',3'-cyclic-nucleotide 2'-phosphodiesterase
VLRKLLMLGDVVGQSGLDCVTAELGALRGSLGLDFVVVNGENAAGGFGITEDIGLKLFEAGADVITTGNHVWQKREALPWLDSCERLLRPANYGSSCPGHGVARLVAGGGELVVINLQGREGLYPIECPFATADAILESLGPGPRLIAIDFHAESFDEKEALALYLDGRVSCLAGTHTHVQTADAKILGGGTGYLGDLGMTGPKGSCIGVKPELSIRRCRTQIPLKMESSEAKATLSGIVFELDDESGKCVSWHYLPA